MSDTLKVWLDDKSHSVEGHTYKYTLYFKGEWVLGPISCHPNTTSLKEAIEEADDRFTLTLESKDHSVEGHIKYISVFTQREYSSGQIKYPRQHAKACRCHHSR